MDFIGKRSVKNPWEKTNPLSHLIFAWILPMFKNGFGNDLTINDLYDAPKVHRSDECARKLEKAWECQKAKGSKPKLWKALVKVHRVSFIIYLIAIAVDELVGRVLQPLYLRLLVKSFNEGSKATYMDKLIYAGVVCACSIFHGFSTHQCIYLMERVGLKCRTACSSLIYRKAIHLANTSSGDSSVGYLMNLLSNDVSRFDNSMIFIPYVLVGPIQFGILLYFLYDEMGVSAFAGAGFILLILPSQFINGTLSGKFREKVAEQTDERSRIMNEIVIAIRVIKMYAWEKPFAVIISRIRSMEVKQLSKQAYLRGFFLALYTFSMRLTAFFVIMTYVLLGNELTADKAFFSVAVFLPVVESMVYCFSSAMTGMAEISVSSSRIEKFLLLVERKVIHGVEEEKKPEVGEETFEPLEAGKVILEGVTASWPESEKATLRGLNLQLEGDKVIMVIGSVGSGKTSLLNLLISELPVLQGEIKCEGKITYASQEAWLFPGNVRQNILFGEPFNKSHYQDVVQACALEDDFRQLPNGDLSIVGERGITLSGGQKARVNLARALYRNANIYAMDDPLSAVDSRVSRHLFEKCIKTFLKGRLRILVTHQLQYLPQADYVVVFDAGEILAQGTYDELVSRGVDFVNLVTSHEAKGEEKKRKTSISKTADEGAKEAHPEYEKPEDNLEQIAEGSVGCKTYWGYIGAAKSPCGLLFVILVFLLCQVLLTFTEYWLSFWTDSEEEHDKRKASKVKIKDPHGGGLLDKNKYLGEVIYLGVYGGCVLGVFIICFVRAVSFLSYCLKISNNLHNRMFESIVRAPTKFYDDNPSGRIMNRFTKDIGSIDEQLPPSFFDALDYFLQMFGVIALILFSNYYLAIPTVIVILIFWLLRIVFIRTSRDVKRLESIWKSPVFTHVSATMQGLTTIRALGAEDKLIAQFDDKQDVHTATWFAFISTAICFAVWTETLGILFMTAVTFSFIVFAEGSSGGLVGLVVTSALALSIQVQWAMRQSAETENHMTSVERALEYTRLPSEAPLESSKDKAPPSDWPKEGEIRFQNMWLSYEDKDVLKDLTFEIKSKEKIGIVGRTGAGKSSIISALFRLTEPRGDIFIDGIRIGEIGLHDLRKNISIIPQDPVLFSGTVRYNLDPFDQFKDHELWSVLEEVQLKDAVSALDFRVSDGGGNFSVGQRQLVCLARAILRRNRIIVLDEATANVDPRTDEFIQKTIRMKFADCSIITIAHRLHSVMDCDKILVLEQGSLMEYDHPHVLLQNPQGMLTSLASHTGDSGMEALKSLAKHHYEKR